MTRRHRVLVAVSIHHPGRPASIRSAGRGRRPASAGARPGGARPSTGRSTVPTSRSTECSAPTPWPGSSARALRHRERVQTVAADRRAAGVDRRRPPGRRGRGPWPSSPTGTRSAPTPPGTPRTGSPSGPGSTSPRTSSARSCSRRSAHRVGGHGAGQPDRAARQVAQARTADLADGELRRRGGFLVTGPPHPGAGERRGPGRRAGRRPRPVPVLGLRDGHGRHAGRAGRRPAPPLEQAAGQARIELRLALRRTGRGLHLHASRWAGGCRERSPRPRVPAHVATTRHLCAAYPLVSEAGLGHDGVLIGRDVLGGSFVYDPFALYRQGVVTNPNMVVIGQIGRGKSSLRQVLPVAAGRLRPQRLGRRPEGRVRPPGRGVGRRPGGAPPRWDGPAQPARHRRSGTDGTGSDARSRRGGERRRRVSLTVVAGRGLPRAGPPAPGAGGRRCRAGRAPPSAVRAGRDAGAHPAPGGRRPARPGRRGGAGPADHPGRR